MLDLLLDNGRAAPVRAELEPAKLIEEARRIAGLADFGDEDFLVPLNKLLQCVTADVAFSEHGLSSFRANIVRCLANRLRTQRDFSAHPEIAEEDVSDPIIIIGLPRTGTTKMQRMLSSLPDSDIQRTPLWQMLYPAPFSDIDPDQPDPRIAAVPAGGLHTDDRPDLAAVHHMTALEPEEDVLMFDATFDDWLWPSIYAPSLSYYEWVMQRPRIENYRYLKRMYQYLQWQNGGKKGRRWISKNVEHIASLDELLAYFPNATIVHCHRDPRTTIPSLSKLTETIWEPLVRDLDRRFVGSCMLEWWGRAIDLYLEARERLSLDARIMDLQYSRIKSDAVGAAAEILERADVTP